MGNCRFKVEVWDYGEPGSSDIYHITVRDKTGAIWHMAGTDSGGVLGGGNIVIHTVKKGGSAAMTPQPVSPAILASVLCLLGVGLMFLKGVLALARGPREFHQMSVLNRAERARRGSRSVRRVLRLPCTLAMLE